MKILVMSDSHGAWESMCRAVEQEQPRQILFLGDGLHDADRLHVRYPDLPIITVPGNCDHDFFDEPERLIEIDGVRILMMHGHTRRVKYDSLAAYYAAREMGAQILLYGHTHRPLVDYDGHLFTMNPGTIGGRRTNSTYGVILIENGKIDCHTVQLEPIR